RLRRGRADRTRRPAARGLAPSSPCPIAEVMTGRRRFVLGLCGLSAACGRSGDGAVRATGTIEVREVDVSPLVPARVVRVLVDDGHAVRLGDTLATLTQSTTRADIAQAEAGVRAAEASLREAVAGARPREIDRAEADLRAAEAEA